MSTRFKNIAGWALAGLLAFGFVGAGFSKVAGAAMQVQNFASWGFPDWLRYPVGLLEIALGVAILLPRFRAAGNLAVFPWVLGAIITHVQANQGNQVVAPLLFAVLASLLLWVSRNKASVSTAQ